MAGIEQTDRDELLKVADQLDEQLAVLDRYWKGRRNPPALQIHTNAQLQGIARELRTTIALIPLEKPAAKEAV